MAAPQQQSGGDNSLGPFWIVAGLFIFGWGIWYFAHEQIAAVLLFIRLWEAKLVSLFVAQAANDVVLIQRTSPAAVSFATLSDISTNIGEYLKYPIAIILALLAAFIYLNDPILRFKKTYSMQMLVDTEKESWPQISPVSGVDLVSANIDEGPWAMALSPMQFAKKFNLLQLERVVSGESFSGQSKISATLKPEETHQVFALQVGRYWSGIDKLNIHVKALFAVFAARANNDRDGATKVLLQIASSTKVGKLDFSGVNALLNKHKDCKSVIKVTQKHAFVLTIMASMLKLARTDGVLASADFLWLKPVDRPLWFMLNSVGRQTPFAEVSGPFAHWLAEVKFGRKIMVPMIDEAVNGLEAALKEIIYIPDENELIE